MIGTSVQRYEILEELGQGGMSVVYRGRDTTLDREIAIKVLHDHLAKEPENRRRFRREAQAIARLQHPHILDVYDYSDEEDDDSYIVMEYIPGRNLRDFLDEHGHPPPEVAAMIGAVVADALAHAHEHGVIHRDLKPENLMVSTDGRLKLMDFGIAHVADAETMTQTGSLLGSPAHMAPEIVDGKEVNRRSDIFSLGTVLYWLSTGEFPFKGDNAPHLLRQVIECNYDDPEAVEPRLSRELGDVIERCLRRDPADRFESVVELREGLLDSLDLVGEVEPEVELEQYFKDPERYTREFEEDIVDRLVDSGRQAMERGDVPEAIAHFNRVLGYEPENEEVQRELEELDEDEFGLGQMAIAATIVAAIGVGIAVALLRPLGGSDAVERASTALRTRVDAAARAQRLEEARLSARRTGREVAARSERVWSRFAARTAASHLVVSARRIGHDLSDGERAPDPPVASIESSGRERNPRPPSEPSRDGSTLDATDPDTGTGDVGLRDTSHQTPSYTYKFKVLPLAATVYLDGERMSVPEVLDGVELEKGLHEIRVVSPGCESYESRFRVDGPPEDTMSVVLEWKDAFVRVLSNRPAVVQLNGNRSRSYEIGANGENARIRIPFGAADSDQQSSRKRLTVEVRPHDDLTIVRRQTVTLRPGEETSVNVNFPRDR